MTELATIAVLTLASLATFAGNGQVDIECARQFLTGGSFAGVDSGCVRSYDDLPEIDLVLEQGEQYAD